MQECAKSKFFDDLSRKLSQGRVECKNVIRGPDAHISAAPILDRDLSEVRTASQEADAFLLRFQFRDVMRSFTHLHRLVQTQHLGFAHAFAAPPPDLYP